MLIAGNLKRKAFLSIEETIEFIIVRVPVFVYGLHIQSIGVVV
jgi:hypothetical protein